MKKCRMPTGTVLLTVRLTSGVELVYRPVTYVVFAGGKKYQLHMTLSGSSLGLRSSVTDWTQGEQWDGDLQPA